MHYDETSRRLNLLSGLVAGAVLGTGLALLLAPGDRAFARRSRSLVRSARALPRQARRSLQDAGGRAGRAAGAARRRFKL